VQAGIGETQNGQWLGSWHGVRGRRV